MTNAFNDAFRDGLWMGSALGVGAGLLIALWIEVTPSPVPWFAGRYWSRDQWRRRKALAFADALEFVERANGNELQAYLYVERRFRLGRRNNERRWIVAAIPCAVAEFQRVAANRELGLPEDTP